MDVDTWLERRVADLAPSHFSFSGFEPDEKRDILYPLWQLVFSDRTGMGEGAEKERGKRTEYDRCVGLVETG